MDTRTNDSIETQSNLKLAVRCIGLTKTYGEGEDQVHALRGVDLEIYTGELLMLVGPSGCGKTTLISVIAGILERSGGECTILGEDYQKMQPEYLANWRGRHVGFVFQQFNLLPTLTAAENVAVPLLIRDKPRDEALKRAIRMLERVGLGNKVNTLPKNLSGGQQQRVAIARAIINRPSSPSLLVCDEPTSALDAEAGQNIMRLLRKIAFDARRALVVVTHDSRIFKYADRIAYLSDGRVDKIVKYNELLPTN